MKMVIKRKLLSIMVLAYSGLWGSSGFGQSDGIANELRQSNAQILELSNEFFIYGSRSDELFYTQDWSQPVQKIMLTDFKGKAIHLVSSADNSQVFAAAAAPYLYEYKVGTGGASWVKHDLVLDSSAELLAVTYLGEKKVLASTSNGFLISDDLGKNWKQQTLYSSSSYYGTQIFSPRCLKGLADQVFLTSTISSYCSTLDVGASISGGDIEITSTFRNVDKSLRYFFDAESQSTIALEFSGEYTESKERIFHYLQEKNRNKVGEIILETGPHDLLGVSERAIIYDKRVRNNETGEYETKIVFLLTEFEVNADLTVKKHIYEEIASPVRYPGKAFFTDDEIMIITENPSMVVSLDRGHNWQSVMFTGVTHEI